MAKRLRKINDELFSVNGYEPNIPEGYIRDPQNPNKFIKPWPECQYRKFEIIERACCTECKITCSLGVTPVTKIVCFNCLMRKE